MLCILKDFLFLALPKTVLEPIQHHHSSICNFDVKAVNTADIMAHPYKTSPVATQSVLLCISVQLASRFGLDSESFDGNLILHYLIIVSLCRLYSKGQPL